MSGPAPDPVSPSIPPPPTIRSRLFRKYAGLFVAVMCLVLLVSGLFEIWLSYREQKASLTRIQHEQAEAAAGKIGQFIKEIETEIGWTTQLPSTTSLRERRFDALRLLRQVPAVTEFAWVDAAGREQLRVSRVATDTVAGGTDLSREPRFTEPMAHKAYYGPVYYRRESEPYMTLALAGARRDSGVSIAEVNLKFIWDVVSQIKAGKDGQAYVVDAQGRLIAHPDISLVLSNTDVSRLAQVQAARAAGEGGTPRVEAARDVQGRRVLTAFAPITPLGWTVFVELPVEEAYAPLYASLLATGLILLVGLVLTILASLMLARKIVTPIRVLETGAAQIGKGALDHRIEIATGDELEMLGNQFNQMAARLQESYATLERKVEERTHQLELANLAKSRFLAAASHDLRQPLHALGLFVAQLRSDTESVERRRIIARIDSAVAAMNDLFNALLDISKLDAGVLIPDPAVFPIGPLLRAMETTFSGAAHEKGLKLRVMASGAWVRSDRVLLERILLNLVSNAVRYTDRGGVVVGCRRHGNRLSIEVWDSGIGIPDDQRRNIFGEFYQLAGNEGRRGGLGLGLAIVDRLCRLLDHPIELASIPGKGSRFAVLVPWEAARPEAMGFPTALQEIVDPFGNKLVVVIDDDALVLEGISGLLRSWGCRVIAGESADAALARLHDRTRCPDLVISDFRLSGRGNGIEAIERLRKAFRTRIPAFLISGDTAPERLREAAAGGYHLLHKPVPPITLRAMLTRFLKDDAVVDSRA